MHDDHFLFSWLHISDLHFGHGGAGWRADQKIMNNELLKDVQSRQFGPERPDAIFITGDIAFSGLEEEYELATHWIDELCATLHLPKHRVFMVPGNHDVDMRNDKNRNTQRMIASLHGGDSIDNSLVDTDDKSLITRRIENYIRFAQKYGPQDDLFWSSSLQARLGLEVRVAGLNTSLLCTRGGDREKLQVGTRQLGATIAVKSGVGVNEILIALTHHPLNWLAKRDRDLCAPMFQRFVDIHLFGHTHEAENVVTTCRGSSLLSINAGAAHMAEGSSRHRYNIAAVRFLEKEGALSLRVWPRVWSTKGFRFIVDNENIDDDHLIHADCPIATKLRPARIWLDRKKAACGETIRVQVSSLPRDSEFDVMLLGSMTGFGVCKLKTDRGGEGYCDFQVPYMNASGKFIKPGVFTVAAFCGGGRIEARLEIEAGPNENIVVRKHATQSQSDTNFAARYNLCVRWGFLDILYAAILFRDAPSVSFNGISSVFLQSHGDRSCSIMLAAESSRSPEHPWLPVRRTMPPLRTVRGTISFRLNRPLEREQLKAVAEGHSWKVQFMFLFAVELHLSHQLRAVTQLSADEIRVILGQPNVTR